MAGLADGASPNDAAQALRAKGVEAVAITLGKKGILVYANAVSTVKAPTVEAVDTVGAGDCFCALLAVGLDEGMAMQDAARFAACGAAISVTRAGAQPSFPTRDEIAALQNNA